MIFPDAPVHMKDLAGQTVDKFGYDTISKVRYKFNNLGYRSDIEFAPTNDAIILLGNTLTFGVGLPIEKTFAGIIDNTVSNPVYNFAWGCYGHTNYEQLQLLKSILKVICPKFIILQINNLNRIRNPDNSVSFDNPIDQIEKEYKKFRSELDTVLNNIPHHLLYWDEETYQFDFSDCLIYNKYHIDNNVVKTPLEMSLFGVKTHKLIATKLLQNI
jgi:hypothetical protein